MDDSTMDLLFASDDGSTMGYDTNGDGMVDTINGITEIDGRQTIFTSIDNDANGVFETLGMELDMDNDGISDAFMIGHDYNQDGSAESIKAFIDSNGTGDFDTVMSFHQDTENHDLAYNYEVDIDNNGDHVSDVHYEDVISSDEVPFDFALPASGLGSATPEGTFDVNTSPELVAGDPASDMEAWEYQGQTNRCALFSQKFVIEQIKGEDIDIEQFAEVAKENGWFTEEGGTNGLNMNKMLDYYGIDNEVSYDADMSDIEDALRNGDKVIVSVDSGQIWFDEPNDIFSPSTVSDHALQVVGIDYSNPDAPMVVLNDSGSPTGCGEMVPFDKFEDAWGAGDHQMVVCHA